MSRNLQDNLKVKFGEKISEMGDNKVSLLGQPDLKSGFIKFVLLNEEESLKVKELLKSFGED
jgi:hypothetical protein